MCFISIKNWKEQGTYICFTCLLLDTPQLGLPRPKELAQQVGELNVTDDHKAEILELALEKANELGLDTLKYGNELVSELMKDFLRKT